MIWPIGASPSTRQSRSFSSGVMFPRATHSLILNQFNEWTLARRVGGTVRKLRIGVAGLGRAFTVMLPTFTRDPRIDLVAAADPRAEARERFAADFSTKTYTTVEELCADPEIEIVYVATPH